MGPECWRHYCILFFIFFIKGEFYYWQLNSESPYSSSKLIRHPFLVHSVGRSFFFAWSQVPLFILERSNSSTDRWVVFYEFVKLFWGFILIAAIALVSSRFLSIFVEILKFSISLIWFCNFFWFDDYFIDLCILFCNFDLFLIKVLLSLVIWCFLWLFFGRTCFLQIFRQILIIISYISSVFTSVKSMSQLVLSRSA